MSDIIWSEKLSVGIGDIDNQHKKLVDMLNGLESAYEKKLDTKTQGETIKELLTYTLEHFSLEEVLMNKYEYPDKENHIKEHESFHKKVLDFYNAFMRDSATLSEDIIKFLQNWIVNHILVTDHKYIDFFHSKGVK